MPYQMTGDPYQNDIRRQIEEEGIKKANEANDFGFEKVKQVMPRNGAVGAKSHPSDILSANADVSTVKRELNELTYTVEILKTAVHNLFGRIGPVLASDPPPSSEGECEPAPESEIGMIVFNIRRNLYDMRREIDRVVDRLEI